MRQKVFECLCNLGFLWENKELLTNNQEKFNVGKTSSEN
jgi:hypothetical protein